jgi:transcriptional regulator with XRE-family HTH domain
MPKPRKSKAEDIDLEFAARIAQAFEIGKITGSLRAKAEALGVSKTFVDDMLHGRVKPSARNLRDIAIQCGVSSDWLLTGLGEAEDVIAEGRVKLDITELDVGDRAILKELVKSMKAKKAKKTT